MSNVNLRQPLLLFLDFDGTLHPNWTFATNAQDRQVAQPYGGPWLTEAALLAALIAPYGDRVQVVLSTWWSFTRPLEEVRALLPEALANRVVDAIWLPRLRDHYRHEAISRYEAIQLWLDQHYPAGAESWLALDDDDRDWPTAARHHLVHAAGTLASVSVQQDLRARLGQFLGDLPGGYPGKVVEG
jgi:hypothetical protein